MFLVSSCSCLCPIHWRQVKNEDVVGAGPTGDAPTISEWWKNVFHTEVRLIIEILSMHTKFRLSYVGKMSFMKVTNDILCEATTTRKWCSWKERSLKHTIALKSFSRYRKFVRWTNGYALFLFTNGSNAELWLLVVSLYNLSVSILEVMYE